MVRTYSFNPSTQSNINLNGRETPSPSFTVLSLTGKEQKLIQSMQETTAGHTPRRKKTKQQQQLPYINNSQINEQNNNSFLENSKQSPTVSNSIVIEEEQTTLFGIRSVLINGQRFFQPLDIPNNNQNKPRKQTTPPIDLIIALNKNNKNINSDIIEQKNYNNFFDDRMAQVTQLNNISMQNDQNLEDLSSYNNFGMSLGQNNIPLTDSINNKNNNLINNQHFIKKENNNKEDDYVLPWARGCPQPKSGQRGSRIWKEGNEKLINKRNGSAAFDHSFATSSTSNWPPPLSLLDERGLVVKQNFKHSISSSNNNISPLNNTVCTAEKHRIELLNQIEENKRRRALEKQKEWEMEEKERIRDERWYERQQAEIEAERRAEREKAAAVERKALKIAAAQKATEQALLEETKRLAEIKAQKRRKQSNGDSNYLEESINDRSRPKSRPITVRNQNINIEQKNEKNINESEEEWWERKDKRINSERIESANNSFYKRQQSPIVPALRKKLENGEEENYLIKTQRSMSMGSINRPNSRKSCISSAFGRTSRLAYTPSIENRNLLNSKN